MHITRKSICISCDLWVRLSKKHNSSATARCLSPQKQRLTGKPGDVTCLLSVILLTLPLLASHTLVISPLTPPRALGQHSPFHSVFSFAVILQTEPSSSTLTNAPLFTEVRCASMDSTITYAWETLKCFFTEC